MLITIWDSDFYGLKKRKVVAFSIFMPLAYCISTAAEACYTKHCWVGVDCSKWNEKKKKGKLKKYSCKLFKTFYCFAMWAPIPWLATQAHNSAVCDKELGGIGEQHLIQDPKMHWIWWEHFQHLHWVLAQATAYNLSWMQLQQQLLCSLSPELYFLS